MLDKQELEKMLEKLEEEKAYMLGIQDKSETSIRYVIDLNDTIVEIKRLIYYFL